MSIIETKCKSALHYHEQEFATNWDLNIYRGCKHQCTYCFAKYSHKYLDNSTGFYDDIYVKTNVAQVLDREMASKKWQHYPVTVSGVSDCYQPIEMQYQLMPAVLSTFIKHANPIVIITKSNLIIRDIELINKLCEVADVNVCISLMTLNENILRALEPYAPSAMSRLETIERLKRTKCKVTLIAAPVIPCITDTYETLEDLYNAAAFYKVDRVQTWALHFRGCDKKQFLHKLGNTVNWQQFNEIYNGSFVNKEYNNWLRGVIKELRNKYNLYDKHIELKYRGPKQISLFDIGV